MNTKTLFVLFYFPPFSRVGGRRWAKHLKYFEKFGEDFHVLAGDFEGKSPWDEDVKSYASKITRIPIKIYYPYFKRKLPNNIIQKLIWQISLAYNKFLEKIYPGNFWDDSRGYEDEFYNKAFKIIKEQSINQICLSVGPFSYSRIFIKLKRDFPKIKTIIDFRDPWEDSFTQLPLNKRLYEENQQKAILEKTDVILTVNDEMHEFYSKKCKNKTIYKLSHCFDPSDINKGNKANSNTNFKLIYGGALYEGIDKEITLLRKFIERISTINSVELNFYSASPGYKEELKHPLIKRQGFLDSSSFFKELESSDYVILILPEKRANAFSSKFYELIAYQKPILYFGSSGNVSRFLFESNLGIHFSAETFEEAFEKFLNNLQAITIPNKEYNIDMHGFPLQTEKLIEFFKND